jgi:hypothetical protein
VNLTRRPPFTPGRFLVFISVKTSAVQWSKFLVTDPEVRVRFPALPDFLRSSGSGTRSIQPREYHWGATLKKK